MNFLKLLPVILSTTLISAHFLRAGLTVVALVVLFSPAILFIRRSWAARAMQSVLVFATLEWIRTIVVLVGARQAGGHSWTRMAIILGVVTLFTAGSAFVFYARSLRERYRI